MSWISDWANFFYSPNLPHLASEIIMTTLHVTVCSIMTRIFSELELAFSGQRSIISFLIERDHFYYIVSLNVELNGYYQNIKNTCGLIWCFSA